MKGIKRFFTEILATVTLTAIALPVVAFADNGMKSKPKSLTEDQKILHVLNRLGFGARPGDVEKVKAIGLQKYIDQQLSPDGLGDAVADSKVANLEIFGMSTSDLFAKYPTPGALVRQLEGGRQAIAQRQQAQQQQQMSADGAMMKDGPAKVADASKMSDGQRAEQRDKLAAIYKEYNLKPAAQLLPQITANRVLRAVYSEKQLQEVMVDFWQNHFNVFSGKNAVKWYIPSYERDVLRKNALGSFKDLLVGTAKHPAMLYYLDNFQSVSDAMNQPNARVERIRSMMQNGDLPPQVRAQLKARQNLTDEQIDRIVAQAKQGPAKNKRGLNENYARELMELHTLGVDGGYTQQDVIEVAKCFTGWTIADPTGYRKVAALDIKGEDNKKLERVQRLPGVPDDIDSGEFFFNERAHEKGAKNVLGQKVDEGGMKDGMKVLDILVASPATAKFIARKLAVKFVNDNPSDELVGRVAKAFSDSKGDIKTTLRALFSDKEFFAPENYRAKIKTPFELAVSAMRAIGAETNSSPAIVAMLNKLGEIPYGYQAPTGYPDTAEDWVNAGALLERLNYSIALASNQIPGTRVDLKRFDGPDKRAVLDKALLTMLDNEVSEKTRETLVKQLDQPLPAAKVPDPAEEASQMPAGNMREQRQARQARLLAPSGNPEVIKVVSLVLGTPEFQRQ